MLYKNQQKQVNRGGNYIAENYMLECYIGTSKNRLIEEGIT